ncbi:hypothetical protein ACFLSJ_08660, partial [Verrucomicrobiota bacterium]
VLDLSGSREVAPGGAFDIGRFNYPGRPQGPGLQGIGVWVHGDGEGELLNFQLRSPDHATWAIGDHYVVVDFEGWRYFELVEPEGERHSDYKWPYGFVYSIWRESVDFTRVESLTVSYNNLPANDSVSCMLSPVKALPLVSNTIVDPSVTIGGKTVTFPVEIETGYYLECRSVSDCRLYGRKGEPLAQVTPQGDIPILDEGENEVEFACGSKPGIAPRAHVTVIARDEELIG